MVENPDYNPMDDEHRAARRQTVDRMSDVATAKRHQQPRDITRFIVLLATVIGVLLVSSTSIAVYSLVRLNSQQGQILAQQKRSAASRQATSNLICAKINDAIHAAQRNTNTLGDLIMDGVKSSRPFENVYHQLGLPDYAARLKLAQQQVAKLKATKPDGINCPALLEDIRRAAR